jgi:hypothetical protein
MLNLHIGIKVCIDHPEMYGYPSDLIGKVFGLPFLVTRIFHAAGLNRSAGPTSVLDSPEG